MAEKKTKSPDNTTVHRIKAADSSSPKKDAAEKKAIKQTVKKSSSKPKVSLLEETPTKNPFIALGRYFKGAWYELKQVRWPTRSATWSMTLAVLVFSAIFIVLILLLDAGFNWIFEQILR